MNFMVFVLSILHRNPHYTSSLSFLSWSKLHRYLLTDLKIKNEMANETTYQSGPNVLHWNVLLWNFCIKYTLINTRDLLPLSACCNCSPYAQTLPPPKGSSIWSVLPSVLMQCTGLNMAAAVVSGNVSWFLVGQPSAGRLVLFEKPKGHLGGGSVVAWWKQWADLLQHHMEMSRKCLSLIFINRTLLTVTNTVVMSHYAQAHLPELDSLFHCSDCW